MTTPTPPVATPIAPPALATATPSAIRDELTNMVIRDLLGPAGGPDEELNQYEDHAYQRYLVGMLAPKDKEVDGGEPVSYTHLDVYKRQGQDLAQRP